MRVDSRGPRRMDARAGEVGRHHDGNADRCGGHDPGCRPSGRHLRGLCTARRLAEPFRFRPRRSTRRDLAQDPSDLRDQHDQLFVQPSRHGDVDGRGDRRPCDTGSPGARARRHGHDPGDDHHRPRRRGGGPACASARRLGDADVRRASPASRMGPGHGVARHARDGTTQRRFLRAGGRHSPSAAVALLEHCRGVCGGGRIRAGCGGIRVAIGVAGGRDARRRHETNRWRCAALVHARRRAPSHRHARHGPSRTAALRRRHGAVPGPLPCPYAAASVHSRTRPPHRRRHSVDERPSLRIHGEGGRGGRRHGIQPDCGPAVPDCRGRVP